MIDYKQSKSDVLAGLREVSDIAEDAGATSLAEAIRDDRIPRIEDERFHLVVLGEFNHGKTSFVNALLGRTVLPVGVTPTTAVIHHIENAAEPRATAVTTGGEELPVELSSLDAYVVDGGAARENVQYVNVRYPFSALGDGVVLVDTPGVNDLNLQRAEITYGYIPRADAVIFLLDAGQILKESERQFISQKLLTSSRDKLVFVVNKMDLLTAAEREEALAYVRTHLEALVPNARVYPVSAQKALAGDRAASGLDLFISDLRRYLESERGRVLLDNGIEHGLRAASILRTSIDVQKRALSMDQSELDTRLAALEADLENAGKAREEREKKVRDALAGAKAVVRGDCEQFAERFALALPDEIASSKSEDLQRFLPSFIEEKFRAFAEDESQEVARRLEAIAELAIAFVSEDAKAQGERLRDALGPAAPTLDLKVNTFAYDVGVFALGAFGVTIMAISNVFVGGALALAAPVLALVFRGRADKEVKRRAMEEAPKVVREAAQKMADAFDDQIDGFGDKLLEFVNKANEEVSRSIAEVVRATRAARKEGASSIAKLQAGTGGALARLGVVEMRLTSLRAALWSNGSGKGAST